MGYTQEYIKQLQADYDAVAQTKFWGEFASKVQDRRNNAAKALETCRVEQVVYYQTKVRECDAILRLPFVILGTVSAPDE